MEKYYLIYAHYLYGTFKESYNNIDDALEMYDKVMDDNYYDDFIIPPMILKGNELTIVKPIVTKYEVDKIKTRENKTREDDFFVG